MFLLFLFFFLSLLNIRRLPANVERQLQAIFIQLFLEITVQVLDRNH